MKCGNRYEKMMFKASPHPSDAKYSKVSDHYCSSFCYVLL